MDVPLGDDLDSEPQTEIDELRTMLRSAMQAARASSEAVQRMAMLQTGGGVPADRARIDSRELLRILPKPDPFPAKTRDEELSMWRSWSWKLERWLEAVDPGYVEDLIAVKARETPVELSSMTEEAKHRSQVLFAVLASLLNDRCRQILKGIESGNGFESYRVISRDLLPTARTRALALLQAINSWPSFSPQQGMMLQLSKLEQAQREYELASNTTLTDDHKMAILLKCLTGQLKQYTNLMIADSSTYSELRQLVQRWELSQTKWANPIAASYQDQDEPTPMEIDRIKGKGKGKGKQDKGKGKNKPGKDKGGKGKDKQPGKSEKGKGYGNQKGKGNGPGPSSNVCLHCGKPGHWKRDCWQLQRETNGHGVRRAEDQTAEQVPAAGAAANTTGNTVRRVEFLDEEYEVFDLTQFGAYGSDDAWFQHGNLFMVMEQEQQKQTHQICMCFDMTYSDSDLHWTEPDSHLPCSHILDGFMDDLSDSVSEHSEEFPCIRAVKKVNTAMPTLANVILDSGADASILPVHMAQVGMPARNSATNQRFHDAQGHPMKVQGRRLVDLAFGSTIIREEFLVAPVSAPLLSVGKLLKHGWNIGSVNGQMSLWKDKTVIPTEFVRNSLCVQAEIRAVKAVGSECIPVKLGAVLSGLGAGWAQLSDGVWAVKVFGSNYMDVPSNLPRESVDRRTTLIYVSDKWWLVEFTEKLSEKETIDEPIEYLDFPTDVITIAHKGYQHAGVLGFEIEEMRKQDQPRRSSAEEMAKASEGLRQRSSGSRDRAAVVEIPAEQVELEMEEPPLDDKVVEEHAKAGADVPAMPRDPDEIEIDQDGELLNAACSLRALRTACEKWRLPKSGGKQVILKRLWQHQQSHKLVEDHKVVINEEKLAKHEAKEVAPVVAPSKTEQDAHALTHYPYQPWCSHCISFKAREDKHLVKRDSEHGLPVVSMNFNFTARGNLPKEATEDKALICLIITDRDTKLVQAVPTPAKGGLATEMLAAAVVRFMAFLGYSNCILKCDNEVSLTSLQKRIQKIRLQIGCRTQLQTIPTGESQANGQVEQAGQAIRYQACILLSQLEEGCKMKIPTGHPLHGWAFVHASFLHCRYHVIHGTTAWEKTTGAPYGSRLVQFGESVMAHVKVVNKGNPRWIKCVWLTRVSANDMHLLVTHGGELILSRSIRRIPDRWNATMVDACKRMPWDHPGHLGGYLGAVKPKRPAQAAKDAEFPTLEDGEPLASLLVNPLERFDDEAASDPETVMPPEEPEKGESPQHKKQRLEEGGSSQAGHVEIAPNAEVSDVHDADMPSVAEKHMTEQHSGDASPQKRPRIEARKKPRLEPDVSRSEAQEASEPSGMVVGCIIGEDEYFHGDELLDIEVEGTHQPALLDHEVTLQDEMQQIYTSEKAADRLWRPVGPGGKEPELSVEELAELDELAKEEELARLSNIPALIPMTADEAATSEARYLSTKFVCSWRYKFRNGQGAYLRRARFVAREFNWWEPDRVVFAPATSQVITKLIPSLYMAHREAGWVMLGLDVKDAYLTVPQAIETKVSANLQGVERHFLLSRCLPGQRDGAQNWHQQFTDQLREQIAAEVCVESPTVIRAQQKFVGMIHVDDMIATGEESFVLEEVVAKLEQKYEIDYNIMRDPGDEIWFLKRKHRLHTSQQLVIQPHQRHFDRLFEAVGLDGSRANSRSTPFPPAGIFESLTEGPLGPEEASRFRTATGILLYLSGDLLECQFAIKTLASAMSSPGKQAWKLLVHLCRYLVSVRYDGLSFEVPQDGQGIISQSSEHRYVLEVFSDADWSGDRVGRKSTSSAVFCLNKHTVYSCSRTQKNIALSSAESEYTSAVSAACDALYLKAIIQFATFGEKLRVVLFLDSSAARGIMQRSGCGRTRHIQGQMLWCQQRLKRGEFELASVPTVYNVADLNTKCLAKGRVQFLRYMLGCVKFDEDGSQHGVWLNVGQDEYDTFEEKEKAKQLIRQIRAEIGARPEFQATGSTTTTNLAKRIFAAGMMRLLVQAGDASKLDDGVDALGRRGVEPNSSDNGNQSAVHLEWTTQDTLEVIATLYVCICVLTCSCRHVWWLWQQMNVFISWCRRCEQSKALQKTTNLESEESDVNSEQVQKVQSACSSGSRPETVLRESSNAAVSGSELVVYVTKHGAFFHKKGCKWIAGRETRTLLKSFAETHGKAACRNCFGWPRNL